MGPWAHGNFSDTIGERSFGVHSAKNALDSTALQLAFFDEHLRDLPGEGPRVRYFLMGANAWVEDEDWPPAGARANCGSCIRAVRPTARLGTACYPRALRRRRASRQLRLRPERSRADGRGSDVLPGPLVSLNAGAKEQASVERRPDVLVYTSPPLDRELDVTGRAQGHAVHRDLGAGDRLHGQARRRAPRRQGLRGVRRDPVAAGARRCRRGRALAPREEQVVIQLGPTAMRFGTGHRLRLDVSSSNFPRFARSPNSAVPPTEARAGDFRTARQRVFHDASRRSFLELVVRR